MNIKDYPGWHKAPNSYGRHFFEVSEMCSKSFGHEFENWIRTNNDEFYFCNEQDLTLFLLKAGHLADKTIKIDPWGDLFPKTRSRGPG